MQIGKIIPGVIILLPVGASLYILSICVSPNPGADYRDYHQMYTKVLAKNGYKIVEQAETSVQLKMKDFSGLYYVDLLLENARDSNQNRLKCRISFYPHGHVFREDKWAFTWETLTKNPKLVGVINYVAKTFTHNKISGIRIQDIIERHIGSSEPILSMNSAEKRYSFRIKPKPSKIACEFVCVYLKS